MSRQPSELFIPTGKEGVDAIKWRLALIRRTAIYDYSTLAKAISRLPELSHDERESWIDIGMKDEFQKGSRIPLGYNGTKGEYQWDVELPS